MANYYTDHPEIAFHLEHPLMKRLVELREKNYEDAAKGIDYAPVDYEDTIENCHAATVTIYAARSSYFHGGIAGFVAPYQTVRGCTSAARVTKADGISGCNEFGGIAGYNDGTIENCLALGATVNVSSQYGAIVGYNSSNSLTSNYYHNCTVGGTANATGVGVGYDYNGTHAPHDRDGARIAYSVSAAAGSSLAPTGTATTAYPYNGIQVFDNNLYYNSVVYVPAYDSNVTVTLTLGCTVPEGYALGGYTATSGTLTLVEGSTYSLTLADADVVISPIFTDQWGIANGANGTEEHPYIITTTAGLDLLATNVNNGTGYSGKYFELANDITYPHTTLWNDSTSQEDNFTAIGNSYANSFEGTFDGKGHTVSGIRIYKPYNRYQGLFGYLKYGTVKNVTLADARITGSYYVGGIVGYFRYNLIENCLVLNAAITANSDAGAVVGYKYDGTLRHDFYRNCIVKMGSTTYTTDIGLGAPQNDFTGEVASVHKLTLGTGITASGESVVIGDTTYYAHKNTITLRLNTGYDIESISVKDASGNDIAFTETDGIISFMMPASDVTVSSIQNTISTGDVNGDGSVTIADVPALVALILSDSPYNPVADVNGDNSVSLADVTALVNRIKSAE